MRAIRRTKNIAATITRRRSERVHGVLVIVGIFFYAVDRCLESPGTPGTWTPQANHFDCAASGVAYLSNP
jgi:hypothetical protein